MDTKLETHVWMRRGNEWTAVTVIPVSQATAEALAMMMSFERCNGMDDYRFCASTHKPSSGGFAKDGPAINGYVIDQKADRAVRHAVDYDRSVETFSPGFERFLLLQQAGLVDHRGWATPAGKEYVKSYSKL